MYQDPQLPCIIPQMPTIKDHKASIKGPLGGPGRVSGLGLNCGAECRMMQPLRLGMVRREYHSFPAGLLQITTSPFDGALAASIFRGCETEGIRHNYPETVTMFIPRWTLE